MPNSASFEIIPEFIDPQPSSGSRLRFCSYQPLKSSDAGLVLLARHAAQCGDIVRIAQALAPKLKAPVSRERQLAALRG